MQRSLRALVLCVLCVLAARAADGPFTLEQVLSSPFPSDLTAATRGSRIAWLFDAQGRRNVWVAEGPTFAARQLTRYSSDDGQELSALQFSPDGNTLVYVRGGNKNSAGEIPNPTSNPGGVEQAVWAITWVGGPARKIDGGHSPRVAPRGNWIAYVKENEIKENQIWVAPLVGPGKPHQIVTRGQNGSPEWSPDGKKLAFVSTRSDHSFIAIYDPLKKTLSYLAPSADRDAFPRWSPDARSVAFVRRPAQKVSDSPATFLTVQDEPNPWAIWVVDVATGQGHEVWHSTNTLEGSVPFMAGAALLNWAADNHLVFASEQDGWQHLYSIPASGGAPALLTPGECEFEHMSFSPDRRTILFSSNCSDIDRRHTWQVAVTGTTPEKVTWGEGLEWLPVETGDAKWVAYLASDAQHPAMPYIRAVGAQGSGKMLGPHALPKDFPSDNLVTPQQVVFDAADGVHIHGQLFLPAGASSGGHHPAIIFMHGGPVRQMMLGWHNMYYYHNTYGMNQYLMSRGYIVLSVNYRSGIAYGRAFRMAPGRGPRGAAEYQDIVAGARYLASRADVDSKRIGLWGGSYGGYLTAMGLARNSDLFAAGVDLHGVHDWSRRNWMGSASAERVKLARESSPVGAIQTWHSPVLLIQGDDDRNVPFNETVTLSHDLRARGVAVEELVFPDEIHDFLLHRTWLAAYHASSDFFDKHFKMPEK
jgi:dipeptidyl aminopeptidase/acylaminoacyl peptidase